MSEQQLTKEESLELIVRMINHAQVNIRQSSFYLLLWGWIISIASITHYVLLHYSTVEHPEFAWFLTIPGVIISGVYGFLQGRKMRISTYADHLYFMIWLGFLVSIVLLQVFFYDDPVVLGIVILLMTGNAVFVAGHALRFNPLIWGAAVFWLGAILGFLLETEVILLIQGVAVILGYLVPGYLLKKKGKDVTV